MVKKILAVFGFLIFCMVVHIGFIAPKSYSVTREIKVSAPANVVFAFFNNPKTLSSWNPWSKQDPNIKLNFEGPQEGIGAVANYDGNDHAGKGKMTITESQPGSMVKYHVTAEKPMPMEFDETYTIKSEGGNTVVSWNMAGPSPFIIRLMTAYAGAANALGDEMNVGLADMKSMAEKEASRIPAAQSAAPTTPAAAE